MFTDTVLRSLAPQTPLASVRYVGSWKEPEANVATSPRLEFGWRVASPSKWELVVLVERPDVKLLEGV